ncbi:hypothetical protein C900_04540 [Fulvivirga imtechensis AK7]|uniref:Uncharacterized protein n=2 Tax=Fulvivirga TaxID=396811 RepID=L8JR72_9BACT|nr:hypothetical protein C900_04540 [Fulvivirga imtechensis AK7]
MLFGTSLWAQGVTLPQSSAAAEVRQRVGIADVTVNYSRPDVVSPQGQDRTGQIWGGLVPYGYNNLGFGTSQAAPWRAGANENTTIELSHDATIEGKALQAGTYGLHMAVAEEGNVTVIFSRNNTAWGSYFYDEKDDALRVNVKWQDNEQTPLLTYNFVDVGDKQATLVLDWEKKRIPVKIEFNTPELVYNNLKKELQGAQGFILQNWMSAANYLAQNKIHLEDALAWANNAIEGQFFSQKNFQTMQVKARVLTAMGNTAEADKVMNEALEDPAAGIADYYNYGRQLIGQDKGAEALEVFKKANKKWPDHWLAPHGLARGYSATGDYAKALKYEEQAYTKAPDGSKQFIDGYLKTLKEGKDFN